MKREIKFRAWIKDAPMLRADCEKGMFYQGIQYLSSFLRRIYDQYSVTHPSYLGFELEERLMQFIGLEDKNGKEIFEGDIVKISGFSSSEGREITSLRQIKSIFNENWGGHQLTWEFISGSTNIFSCQDTDFTGYIFKWNSVEIIGNIHENPDLLKD